jgi:hypothetical protein
MRRPVPLKRRDDDLFAFRAVRRCFPGGVSTPDGTLFPDAKFPREGAMSAKSAKSAKIHGELRELGALA